MSDAVDGDLLQRARDAAAHGDLPQAFDLFVEADADRPLGLPDLAILGDIAYGAGHLDVTIQTWERAYAGSYVPATRSPRGVRQVASRCTCSSILP